MEQEKFTFRSYIKFIPHASGFRHNFFQDISRITLKSSSVRLIYITDQPRYLPLLWSPREDLKSIQIWIKIHIRFFNPCESFYGRAIKHNLIIQCLLQLTGGNCNILHCSKDICELQADKSHILFFHHSQNIFSRIIIHDFFLLII